MPGTLADGADEYRRRHPRPKDRNGDDVQDRPAETPRQRLDRGAALYRRRSAQAAGDAS